MKPLYSDAVRALGLAALAAFSGCTGLPAPSDSALFVNVHGDPVDPLMCEDGGLVVWIFITTDCPIANGYSPQLAELFAAYAGRPVTFHLVHVDPALTVEEARKHAEDYGHTGSVLLDPEHRLVRRAGAEVTPEAFVFSGDGTIHYRGRINNWYGDIGRKRVHVSKHELRDAIDAVLAGEPVAVPRTEAVGCVIEPIAR